jgi:hypothetical protein
MWYILYLLVSCDLSCERLVVHRGDRDGAMPALKMRSSGMRAGRERFRLNLRASRNVVVCAKTADGPRVAIVGVSGAVGQEFLRVCPFIFQLLRRIFGYVRSLLLADTAALACIIVTFVSRSQDGDLAYIRDLQGALRSKR